MSNRRRKRKRYCERQVALWIVRGRERMSERVQSMIEASADDACRGIDLAEQREQLVRAIYLNVDNADDWPFPRLGITFLSERDFYRRRYVLLDALFGRLKVGKE